ncbi:MAG: hypothetical protein IJY03_04480 [Prevotella sp.]|nr:hypothetical protein [Prevotella sp.]
MKKSIILSLLLAIVSIMATGCTSCQSENKKQETVYHDFGGVVQDFTAGVSHIQALHRQKMYNIIQFLKEQGHEIALNNYQWRNSLVILNDTVTAENIDDLHIVSIRDVFYYWSNKFGPQVQYITDHVVYGTQIPYPISDVWIEDKDMSNAPIKLSAEDALNRLKEWNGILPKDCNFLTLRLPVGPKDCNPQWVFGDVFDVLFIDAVTGEIRTWNPAFSEPKQE